jgi:hypothetical protein
MYCETTKLEAPTGTCLEGYFCILMKLTAGVEIPLTRCMNNDANQCYSGAKTNTGITIKTADTAKVCPAGHYCPSGTFIPIACPIGTYSAATGQIDSSTCAPCDANFFCLHRGQTG